MSDMVNVRKSHAGTDSAGHTWPTNGAVIEVPVEHALVLVRIPDGGFTIIENTGTPESTGSSQNSEAIETSTPSETADKASKPDPARTARAKAEDPPPAK
jgi:hypothetical protein